MSEHEFYAVFITCESSKKLFYCTKHDCESLQDVARLLLTYKPKKTYDILKVEIELQFKLV